MPLLSSSTMTTAMSHYTNQHLAAAVAAAAELARTGGGFTFSAEALSPAHNSHSPSFGPPSNIQMRDYGRDSPSSSLHDDDEDDEDEHDDEDSEEGAERRIARSRERNREHARRTRLRKKAQLEALQSKVKGLQAEAEVLKQSLEECSLASILVGLSHSAKNKKREDNVTKSLVNVASDPSCKEAAEIAQLVGGKRKRFLGPEMLDKSASNQPLKLKINGRTTLIGGGRSHINWKTGVYSDENGVQNQLTQKQLGSLRRERNRMHAKMTRDRKKNFIATIEKTIDDLESNNTRMKEVLSRVVQTHFKGSEVAVTAAAAVVKTSPPFHPVTPESTSMAAPQMMDEIPPLHSEQSPSEPPAKKFRHGFTLS